MSNPNSFPPDSPEALYLKSLGVALDEKPAPEITAGIAARKQRLAEIDNAQARADLLERLTGGR